MGFIFPCLIQICQLPKMSELIALSKTIWNNSIEIEFGSAASWDQDCFKKTWYTKCGLGHLWPSNASGWYWIISDLSYKEMNELEKPPSLPHNGCDLGYVSTQNMNTFGLDILCQHSSQEVVIYNGHEKNIKSRIRSHFSLTNQDTGALGIRHYELSNRVWRVRYFTSQQMDIIEESKRERLGILLDSKSGRCSIESAWRMSHGWPILCKQ